MRLSPGRKVLTVLGWTPGLRQLLRGHVLACGCLVGVYQTWDDRLAEIVDGCCRLCECSGHEVDRVLAVRQTIGVTIGQDAAGESGSLAN